MPKNVTRPATITLRLGPKLRADLERYARMREMSVGEFVRYCVMNYIEQTPADPASD